MGENLIPWLLFQITLHVLLKWHCHCKLGVLTVFLFSGGKWRCIIHLYMPHWSGHVSFYPLFFFSKVQLMVGIKEEALSRNTNQQGPLWSCWGYCFLYLDWNLRPCMIGLSGLPCTNCSQLPLPSCHQTFPMRYLKRWEVTMHSSGNKSTLFPGGLWVYNLSPPTTHKSEPPRLLYIALCTVGCVCRLFLDSMKSIFLLILLDSVGVI